MPEEVLFTLLSRACASLGSHAQGLAVSYSVPDGYRLSGKYLSRPFALHLGERLMECVDLLLSPKDLLETVQAMTMAGLSDRSFHRRESGIRLLAAERARAQRGVRSPLLAVSVPPQAHSFYDTSPELRLPSD